MHSTPNILRAHDESYKIKRIIRDEEMWMMGKYILSAVSVAVEHAIHGNKAKSEYIKEPFLRGIAENTYLTQEELDKKELDKMILYEEQWAKQAKRNGLPETIIK